MPRIRITYEVEVPHGFAERLESHDSGAVAELSDLMYEQRTLLDAPMSVEFS